MIKNFRDQWALDIFGGRVAHYFVRDRFEQARSRCGVMAPVRWLYERGDFPVCKRCGQYLAKNS